jgi:hypothetical protein
MVGWIRDSIGQPVGQADIFIESMHAVGRTDSTGRFTLRPLDPGAVTVHIRRFGFEPQSFDFVLHAASEDSVAVTMTQNAHLLATVRTDASPGQRQNALADFYHRRAKGGGVFITREEIEQRHTNVLSEALRQVPGIRLVRGSGGRSALRFESANAKRYDCPPQYWIDGRRVSATEIDDYPATDVEAIELYHGPATTPIQFSQGTVASCGTVVIWTRVPGGPAF